MEILILRTILGSIKELLTNTLDEEGFRHFIKKLFVNNDLKQIFLRRNFENTLVEVIEKKDKIRTSILVDRKTPGLYLNKFGNKRKSFKNTKKYNEPTDDIEFEIEDEIYDKKKYDSRLTLLIANEALKLVVDTDKSEQSTKEIKYSLDIQNMKT
ncbi:hypothetical protein ACO0SA_001818 [Hanseniaspora valbyensis]